MVPCTLYIRMISSLEEGLLIAGFMNEIVYRKPTTSNLDTMGLYTSDHFILYRPDKDTVEGISKSLTNRLGISIDDILRKMQSHSSLSMGE
jgi:hypothetical protein